MSCFFLDFLLPAFEYTYPVFQETLRTVIAVVVSDCWQRPLYITSFTKAVFTTLILHKCYNAPNTVLIASSKVQMKSHIVKTTAACFAVLCRLRSIRRSVPHPVLQSLLSCLVLSRLDHGNAVLAGISVHLLKHLQSVINSAARLVFSSSKFDHVTPLLHQLHWLSAPWRIN